MAKQPPETRERFRIHGETSKEEFGEYLAVLTRMGLQNIGFELITDVAAFKERVVQTVPGPEFGAEFVKANPTFRAVEMVRHFEASGRTKGSAYAVIQVLLKLKTIRKVGKGVYQDAALLKALPAPATPMKALAPPKKAPAEGAPKPKYAKGHAPKLAIGNYVYIWDIIKNRKRFHTALIAERFAADNRNIKSISPVLTKMGHEKLLKSHGHGDWEVIGKPKPKPAGKPKSPKKRNAEQHVNGADQSAAVAVVETILNG